MGERRATVAGSEAACREQMSGNARRYHAELAALDAWVRASVTSVPEEQRVLVTAHDAFSYDARAYGLTVVGVQRELKT